jgi:quinol monooxygenase YgiN
MYVTTVKVRVKPTMVAAYEKAFQDLAVLVRANEPGVPFYHLVRDPEVPHGYIMIEAYKTQADQVAHIEKDYYKAACPNILRCIESEHDIDALVKKGVTEPSDLYPYVTGMTVNLYETI